MGKMGEPEDLSGAVVFLSSDVCWLVHLSLVYYLTYLYSHQNLWPAQKSVWMVATASFKSCQFQVSFLLHRAPYNRRGILRPHHVVANHYIDRPLSCIRLYYCGLFFLLYSKLGHVLALTRLNLLMLGLQVNLKSVIFRSMAPFGFIPGRPPCLQQLHSPHLRAYQAQRIVTHSSSQSERDLQIS